MEIVKSHLERIAGDGVPTPAIRLVGRLHADLRYHDDRPTAAADPAFLDRVVDTVAQAHEALAAQYFAT
jgi:uncharacterized alpha-E superfamily protein